MILGNVLPIAQHVGTEKCQIRRDSMKRPKPLTRSQKIFLAGKHLDPINCRRVREYKDRLIVRHVHTNALREVLKAG